MGNKVKKFVSATLATGMILTSGITSVVSAQSNDDIYKAIDSINNTIKLNSQINMESKFDIAPDVNTKTDEMVSVIVELKEAPIAVSTHKDAKNKLSENNAAKKVKESKDKFKADVAKMKKSMDSETKIEFSHEYDTVFNGISMKLPGKDIEKLLKSDQVKTIWNNAQVKIDLPKANQKAKTSEESQTPFMSDSVNDIEVNKLHEKGIKGKGIKVGVLDTGIDYNHPDLKDNYKGSKDANKNIDEVKGWDFIDNDSDPMETTRKDWIESGEPENNPFTGSSYYTSHGTHVSGTIAGNGASEGEYSVIGVAPESDLYVYRVLGPYGSGATDGIIAGVEKAVKDGMDVINLSLGSDGANQFSPLTVACNNSTLAGVTTVLANGNAGPGIGSLGSPAVSPLSIAVGASTTAITLDLYNMTIGDVKIEGQTFAKTFDSSITDFNDMEIVDCGFGATTDFEGKELKDKIALIERGELSLNEKIMNAKVGGAKFVIIYNNVDGEIPHYIGESTSFIPSIALSKEEGESLKAQLANGNNKLSLNISGETKTEKDLLGDFSSRGPSPDSYEIKPDVAAPGVNIFSTYPEFINDTDLDKDDYTAAYARISGTSMATPHVSGVAALIKQENKEYDPFDIKLALMNTADDLKLDYGVNEVGAGRVNAYEAVSPGIFIKNIQKSKTINDNEISDIEHETGSISFGKVLVEGKTTKVSDELIINNNTNKTKTFDVSVEYVEASETHGGKDAVKNGVKLDVKETATASKNKETKLGVNLIIPKDAELGLYQGYINLVGTRDTNEKYQVPFSVKVSEPGMQELQLFTKSMTNDEANIMYSDGYAGIEGIIEFRSDMKTVDVVVKDGKTKELVGYVGTMDGEGVPLDVPLYMSFIINQWASVNPYKDGKIQPYKVALEEGFYTVELIGTDSNGKKYTSSQEFIVDNTPVQNSYKLNGNKIGKNEIIEVTDEVITTQKDNNGVEHEAVWIDGNLYDSAIDELIANGETENEMTKTKLSQALNQVTYRLNGSPFTGGSFRVDDEGNYKFGVTKEDVKEYGYEMLDMDTFDMAHVREPRLNMSRLTFVKEGEVFAKLSSNKETLNKDEEAKINLTLNNIKDISSGEFKFGLINEYELIDIKVKDEYKDNYNLSYDIENDEYSGKIINVKLDNKKDNEYISGDVDLLEVTIKLTDDSNPMTGSYPLNMMSIKLIDKNKSKIDVKSKDSLNIFANVNSQISGLVSGEGIQFFAKGTLTPEKQKMSATLKDMKGKEYYVKIKKMEGMFVQNGWLEIEALNLPVTDEYLELILEVPGHFEEKAFIRPSKLVNGKLMAKYIDMGEGLISQNIAGDVNNDGVIDINDAKEIAKEYNKEYKNGDLTLDLTQNGVVDNEDMYFVVKNFKMTNPYSNKDLKPEGSKAELQKVLDDIKYEEPDTGI